MKKVEANILIFLPVLAVIYFVYKFGIMIPFWDQWELVPLLEKMHNHTLTLGDVWMQHNEHRIIFPQILMLFLARISGWNIFLELCTNVAMAIFILFFLLLILKDTLGETSPFLRIFFSLMVFSPVQYENWSWGWQIQIFMSVLGTIISVWAANKWAGKAGGLTIAISGAVLSSYSFSSGLMTWPVLLFMMAMKKGWKLKHIAVLIAACAATVALYFHNYTKCDYHPSVLFFMSHPVIYAEYVLAYIGAPLAYGFRIHYLSQMTAIVMLALIFLAIVKIRRIDRQKLANLAPWMSLSLFVFMSACVTGLGRSGFGWGQALSSRYTTISVLFAVSAGVFLIELARIGSSADKKKLLIKRLWAPAVIAAFLILYIAAYIWGLYLMQDRKEYCYSAAFCLSNPQKCDAALLTRLYPRPDIIKNRAQTLIDLGIRYEAAGEYPKK